MANFFKRLKIANGIAGRVITTDNNGVLIPTNTDVNNLADINMINALDSRVTTLEGAVEDVGQRLQNING